MISRLYRFSTAARAVGTFNHTSLCALSRLLSSQQKDNANRVRVINADQPFPTDSVFKDCIRLHNCYVDRTQFIKPVLAAKRNLFLRPRRFGKSLWLSTLEEFFSGNPEWFKGLAVYDEVIKRRGFVWSPKDSSKHNFPACPVIHLDFSQIKNGDADIVERAMQNMALRAAERNGVSIERDDASAMLASLIQRLAMRPDNEWKKVVVLIDECDHIWAKSLHSEHSEAICAILKSFFSTLKSMREVEFEFVTGIAPMALTGLFSGPNDLDDLSLMPNVSTLCGFTQAEVEHLLQVKNRTFDLKQVKRKYNGYCWDTENLQNTLYNPFVIRNICDKGKLKDFWVQTSSQSIVKLLNGPRPELKLPREVSRTELVNVPMEDMAGHGITASNSILSFLFYAGYATIKEAKQTSSGTQYKLDYPNEEVANFITNDVFKYYGINPRDKFFALQCKEMVKCLRGTVPDLSRFFQIFNDMLSTNAGRPAKDTANYEGYHQQMLAWALKIDGQCEVTQEHNNMLGYIDLTMRPSAHSPRVFVLEFKIYKKPDKKATKQTSEQEKNKKTEQEKLAEMAAAQQNIEANWKKLAVDAIDQIERNRYRSVASHNHSHPASSDTIAYGVVCDAQTKRVALIMDSNKNATLIPTGYAITEATTSHKDLNPIMKFIAHSIRTTQLTMEITRAVAP